ncbi:MAG: MFS transporter [Mogibacterium sp.]|nr:MFS transporter [Mogibacterium sp.]
MAILNNEDKRKSALRVATLTSFLTTFMSSALNLSIPAIGAEFNANAAYVGWIVTAYTLVVAAFCIPMGKISDMKGHGRMLKLGLILFTVTTFACMFIPNMEMFIAVRVIQGLAASMIFANNNAILLSAYTDSERGRVLGISTAATYIGLSTGPVIGGVINHNLGWKYIFLFGGVVAIAAVITAVRKVEDDRPEAATGPIDKKGMVLFVPMILALLYGFSLVGASMYAYVLLAAAIILLAVFIRIEKNSEEPVLNVRMIASDRQFACSNLAALLNYGATFAISYLMSIYLQMVMGYSSQTAGLILVIMPFMQALFSPKMGKLSDSIAPYKLATAGMVCCVATLIVFAVTLPERSIVWVIAALALGGFGFALFSSPNTNAIMSRVAPQDRGQGMAVVSTMRTVGQSFSMCIVTVLVNLKLGAQTLQSVPRELLIGTMRLIFMVFAGICVAGAVISSARSTLE